MKNTQPRIEISPRQTDRFLDVASWFVLVAVWTVALYGIATLPDTIATHFNFHGEPDGWGSPLFLLFMPVVATLLVPLLTWLNQRPHIFNYPVKITHENAKEQYLKATRLIRTLKFSTVMVFLGIELMMWLSADGTVRPRAIWMLPAILLLILGPVAVYLFSSTRKG
jgi:uncharacterized membrane protein